LGQKEAAMQQAGKAGVWAALLLALLALAGCDAPNTEGLKEERGVRVAQAIAGDRVSLEDGQVVYLIGIEAPRIDSAARDGLERLAAHRPAKVAHEGVADLGEKGALGHLFVQTEGGRWVWVQEALLLEGLARVRTRKDGAGRAAQLLAAETAAREAGRGLWGQKAFRIRDAQRNLADLTTLADTCRTQSQCRNTTRPQDKASAPPEGARKTALRPPPDAAACEAAQKACGDNAFQIVEGKVRKVFITERGAAHLDFGDPDDKQSYKTDFSLYIAPADASAWPGGAQALGALVGARVRARGLLTSYNGPSIRIDHPAALELLGEK
jgi:micrococcal nuclease